jgi:hypothetical protein
MNRNRLLAALVAAVILSSDAFAHGTHEPLHGGTVKMVGETAIELVAEGSDAYVYVVEHDGEYSSVGSTGTLTILKDGAISTVALEPAGENRLMARGAVLGAGARVVVALTLADGTTKLSARFSLK